ncbi:uncharacterized protein CLUP02_01387 [Colletotrichum lupini]|uniref:Uncharacterized protein n=1 Tax=Colletotrichum lupini TaxID=145971 RepID=A0A9Q8W9W2_9PEZI|nr:uncharacterized protein CLUP02_01387 [Colletotrichum lupini]UQC74735.1 hypothetical protein CLUP02_01387 [Colletotrichum lupini]
MAKLRGNGRDQNAQTVEIVKGKLRGSVRSGRAEIPQKGKEENVGKRGCISADRNNKNRGRWCGIVTNGDVAINGKGQNRQIFRVEKIAFLNRERDHFQRHRSRATLQISPTSAQLRLPEEPVERRLSLHDSSCRLPHPKLLSKLTPQNPQGAVILLITQIFVEACDSYYSSLSPLVRGGWTCILNQARPPGLQLVMGKTTTTTGNTRQDGFTSRHSSVDILDGSCLDTSYEVSRVVCKATRQKGPPSGLRADRSVMVRLAKPQLGSVEAVEAASTGADLRAKLFPTIAAGFTHSSAYLLPRLPEDKVSLPASTNMPSSATLEDPVPPQQPVET